MAEQGSNDTIKMKSENSDFLISKSKSSFRDLYPSLLAVGNVLDNTYFKVSGRSPRTN